MSAPQIASRWQELLEAAFDIIDHVNRDHDLLTEWTFGGGTAMMIQIDHRESHDVDLFLDDPQLLPYVEAAVAEMQFALGEATYNGDGTGHLKVAFDGIGEIDFIVTAHVSDHPTSLHEIEGRSVRLETVPEIIGKKIRYRGARIQPRDIFDIAAAVKAGQEAEIIAVLSEIPEYVAATIQRIEGLSTEFVSANISQLVLRDETRDLVETAFDTTLALLKKV